MTREEYTERLIAILVVMQRLLPSGVELDVSGTEHAPTLVELRLWNVALETGVRWILWEGEVESWTHADATLTWLGERAIVEQAATGLRALRQWLLEAGR